MTLTVHLGVFEFPRRHLVFEQEVNLAERPILCLWEPEDAPDKAEEVGSSVEEARLGPPVPRYRKRDQSGEGTLYAGPDLQVDDTIRGVTELLKI
jgi:hypothetical protein